jgi:hypothetical protein
MSNRPPRLARRLQSGYLVRCIGLLTLVLSSISTQSSAQTSREPESRSPGYAWSSIPSREQDTITNLLKSEHWPLRVFALLRLERFSGPEVEQFIRTSVKDHQWQVRCFAIRQAAQMGYALEPEQFREETTPQVIRAAMRSGVPLGADIIESGTMKLMRLQDVEMFLLGLEIATASDLPRLRAEAKKRFTRIVNNMNGMVLARTSRRLARIAGIDPPPQTLDDWRVWFKTNRRDIPIARPVVETGVKIHPLNEIAAMEPETYSRLNDYLNFLKQQDLEVAIAMDFTNSMTPMINQARAGVDSIIIFLNDISHSMRLSFVAYRSHANPPNVNRQVLTEDVDAVRNFLFSVPIIGGADFPEDVLNGLRACAGLEWNEESRKKVILVGDAMCYQNELYQVMNVVDSLQDNEIIVHTVHVPMDGRPYRASEEWISNYHRSVDRFFTLVAERGGGRKVVLQDAELLVPAIMHFALEESWWSTFDEFYLHYLDICR